MKYIYYILTISVVFISSNTYAYVDKYDLYFIKWNRAYFNPYVTDWRLHKAQSIAESNLNPNAISPVGAGGLMQHMPATWKEINKQRKTKGSVHDPGLSIANGIYYDRKLYNQWRSPRPEKDRWSKVWGSYNAGLGNILKAQKACMTATGGPCNLWKDMVEYAPYVNTWKSSETINYVKRIWEIYDKLKQQK